MADWDHLTQAQKPHQNQPVLTAGTPLEEAQVAVILLHGRGTTAQSILQMGNELSLPGVVYLAPQAEGNSWYPYPFAAPLSTNEPRVNAALSLIAELMSRVQSAGILAERVALFGFSQGACLALEFAVRQAQRYGAIIGLSGGLLGPDNVPRHYAGSLNGTPVFLGCSEIDAHIPRQRVEYSAEVLTHLGGVVTRRMYRGLGHAINQDEMRLVRRLLASLASPDRVGMQLAR